ncbi:MAG: hypothetical protein HON78_05790 [Legionellales bacterium]|nr:hypothetical protein [Legionellales bacterium]
MNRENKDKLHNIVKQCQNASGALHRARIMGKEPTDIELELNFMWLNQFINIANALPVSIDLSAYKTMKKCVYILKTVYSSLQHLPSKYKALIQDPNCCSLIYDCENLYYFFYSQRHNEPFNEDISKETIDLTKSFLKLVIEITESKKLHLKTILPRNKVVVKFNRESGHFEYFSYFNDKSYLEKSISVLSILPESVYQLLAIIAKLGENLSRRNISGRIVGFLKSDINIDILATIRNFILHREKDLTNYMQFVFIGNKGPGVDKVIKKELENIKKSLEDVLTFLTNKIDSNNHEEIQKFYKTSYQKVSISQQELIPPKKAIPQNLADFLRISENQDSFNKVLKTSEENDKDAFVNSISGFRKNCVQKFFKDNAQKIKESLQLKPVIDELNSFIKYSPISFDELEKLESLYPTNFSLNNKEDNEKALTMLRTYSKDLEKIILSLCPPEKTSKLESIIDAERGFDNLRIMCFPGSFKEPLGILITDRIMKLSGQFLKLEFSPPRYKEVIYDNFELKILGGIDVTLSENQIGIFNLLDPEDTTNNRLCYKIDGATHEINMSCTFHRDIYDLLIELCDEMEGIADGMQRFLPSRRKLTEEVKKIVFDHIIKDGNLSIILVPFTHEEYETIFRYTIPGDTRVPDATETQKIKQLIQQGGLEERLEQNFSFLEICDDFKNNKQISMTTELLLVFIQSLCNKTQINSASFDQDMREFRNYLSHNGRLHNLEKHQSHHQSVFKYAVSIKRQLNEIIIPKLEEKTSNWDAEPTSTPSLHEL